jgi:DNA-binding transcriptional ArsR family regulator
MEKVISGNALRERLLKRLEDTLARPHDDWVQALAPHGNRELLGLIAIQRPRSISELSESAGRAQSNVSRSLTALINAGLVEVRSEGRVSIPTLTDLGREKAQEIGLLESSVAPSTALPSRPENGELPFLSISFADDQSSDDRIIGDLLATTTLRGDDEPIIAKMPGDFNKVVLGILDHWWRMLYRRDAPYKIGEFAFSSGSSERRISVAIKSTGNHIERVLRLLDGPQFQFERSTRLVSLEAFERDLLDNVVRPVASRMRSHRRYDRPIQSKLARLDDTYAQSRESAFARTAGALGISPYELSDDGARNIRDLIAMMPDEEPRLDFASAVLSEEYGDAAEWTRVEISKQGVRNTMAVLRELSNALRHNPSERHIRPWQLGYAVAGRLRTRLNLKPDVSVAGVAKLAATFGAESFQASPLAPASLRAFQSHLNDAPTIVVQEEGPASTTFTLARAIGDFLAFRNNASCVANLYTDRQAVGRAFAAEFTAPAEGIVKMIEEEDQSFPRVASHYGVPEDVIHHQYDNNQRRFVEASID